MTKNPDHAYKDALAAYNAGNLELTAQSCAAILHAHPTHFRSLHLLGVLAGRMGNWQAATRILTDATTINPANTEAHKNLGVAHLELRQLDQALAAFDTAIAINPAYAEAYFNRALTLRMMNAIHATLEAFDRTIALQPDHIEARWFRSLILLTLGDFTEGWRDHELRLARPNPPANATLPKPLWLGAEDIAGKTLFIHWEQGLGDTIQFARYAILAADRGANVILSVQPSLTRLLRHMDPRITIIGPGARPAFYDFHCPTMSLPLAFATTLDSIPAWPAYIKPETPARTPRTKPVIGLVWSGNPNHSGDAFRSIPLTELAPLLALDADFRCMQKEVRPADHATAEHFPNLQFPALNSKDLLETAALLADLDILITVDTALAHLAGAMGIPVWIMLPNHCDWRWLIARDDSPWYPSARLFRQPGPGDWRSLMLRIADELTRL